MKPVYSDTRLLDSEARQKYALTEEIMMENAACALEETIFKFFPETQKIVILAGSGNNGADGYVLARRNSRISTVIIVKEPKSPLSILQKNRAEKTGVEFVSIKELLADTSNSKFNEIFHSTQGTVIADCIFGSGFHGQLPEDINQLVSKINLLEEPKISCDIPTGLDENGNASSEPFRADYTVTMGALKKCLFSDKAKDFTGRIICSDLGVKHEKFCESKTVLPEAFLLETTDLSLPNRKFQNTNKGTFGHAAIVTGEKTGAGVIAGCAALRFGAGLATLVNNEKSMNSGDSLESLTIDENGFSNQTQTINGNQYSHSAAQTSTEPAEPVPEIKIIPYELMCSKEFPSSANAAAIGMGLGRTNGSINTYLSYLNEHKEISCVLDADIFYYKELKAFLEQQVKFHRKNIVLTPHPKEFLALLKNCMPSEFSAIGLDEMETKKAVTYAAENRFELVKKFCTAYPGIVLLLKGSNSLIARNDFYESTTEPQNESKTEIYINSLGNSALSKAGSGDVLAGMITALLAQKSNALEAALNAGLAHSLAAGNSANSFSLTPFNLMKQLENLQ